MARSTRLIGGASILLAPLALGIGDQLRMLADPPTNVGLVNGDYGVAQAAASLASINANRGMFLAASYVMYVGMLLTIPALLAIWRLSVDKAPRWAWTGAVMAVMYTLGQTVHLTGHFAMNQAFSAYHDLNTAAELMVAMEEAPFVLALFVPLYLLGFLGAVPQAIGLKRARVLPLWACLAVIAGTVLFLMVGSTPWSSALWTVLIVGGLAPAALTMLRSRRAQPLGAPITDDERPPGRVAAAHQ